MIAAALLALAVATPTGTPTVDTFSEHAGFAKAILERRSITVGVPPAFWDGPTDPESRHAWLAPVLYSWNDAAGWTVFVPTLDDHADVVFHTVQDDHPRCGDGAGACAWIDEFPAGQYRFEQCHVELWPWFPTADVVAHELGHCLGFVDVPESAEVPGGYAGIMTHDRPWGMTPDNEYDRASLVEAGYRTEAP